MMNRRDFLKALGLATGAAFVPAPGSMPKAVGSMPKAEAAWPDKINPLRRRHGMAAEDNKAKWGDIRIDGVWYTLDGADIEYNAGIQNWSINGRTRSTMPIDLQLRAALVDVELMMAGIPNISGKAILSSVENNIYVGNEIMNTFVLSGVGPLVNK